MHNIYPGQIDLIVRLPTFIAVNSQCEYFYRFQDQILVATPPVGTSSIFHISLAHEPIAAFALSSGTIGAALSGSLSKIRAIAISYGTVIHPTPKTYFDPAHVLGIQIIQYLWQHWGRDEGGPREGEVDLYSINIPLVEDLLSEEGLKICWTHLWRNSYGRLFKDIADRSGNVLRSSVGAGSGALSDSPTASSSPDDVSNGGDLKFKWAPDMNGLITPTLSVLPEGSDGWALHHGFVSVTPLRASFGEPAVQIKAEDRIWKMKL